MALDRGAKLDERRFPGQMENDPAAQLDAMARFGITPTDTLIELSKQANERVATSNARSSLASLTYETAIEEAHEALVGLAADLAGNTPRKSLRDMFTHGDRLRGLGLLLIMVAFVGLLVDYIMNPRST